jgi:predicted transcriptional regulator/transcriptional regulator with XRE-family HTH domain
MPPSPPLTDDRRSRGQRLEAVVRDRWRERSGISGLSEAVGVSRATLYSWFRGDTVPDVASMVRLAEVLNVAPDDLLAVVGGTEPDPGPPAMMSNAWTERELQLRGTPDLSGQARLMAPALESRRAAAPLPADAERYALRRSWRGRLGRTSRSPRLLAVMLDQPVMTCTVDEPIGQVVERMFDRSYSQLPVYKDKNLVGLLTGDTVGRWLGAMGTRGNRYSPATPVSDVLAFAESTHAFELVGPDARVGEALLLFDQAMDEGRPLTAVLVTSDGMASGTPMAILTPTDLPRLQRFG